MCGFYMLYIYIKEKWRYEYNYVLYGFVKRWKSFIKSEHICGFHVNHFVLKEEQLIHMLLLLNHFEINKRDMYVCKMMKLFLKCIQYNFSYGLEASCKLYATMISVDLLLNVYNLTSFSSYRLIYSVCHNYSMIVGMFVELHRIRPQVNTWLTRRSPAMRKKLSFWQMRIKCKIHIFFLCMFKRWLAQGSIPNYIRREDLHWLPVLLLFFPSACLLSHSLFSFPFLSCFRSFFFCFTTTSLFLLFFSFELRKISTECFPSSNSLAFQYWNVLRIDERTF